MKPFRAVLAAFALSSVGQACAVGSLADLNVYDRTEGRQLAVHWHQGRVYVVGKPGNEYQVTLRNRTREEILGVVSVDGVNVVSGETADPGQTGYVLGAYRSYEILGWRKSLAETAAFYFTTLPDSYAARTGRPDNVGVIGVALFRKKVEPQPATPQPGQLGQSGRGAAAEQDSRLGTGHGRRETSEVRLVAFERASSQPAETLTIYYDSYRNLVARGVIREAVAPLPRPFPGFVPDPRG